MADVVESFIAALYIDKDIEHVQKFCEICLFPKLAVSDNNFYSHNNNDTLVRLELLD